MNTPVRSKPSSARSRTPYERRSSTGCFAAFKSPCSSISSPRSTVRPNKLRPALSKVDLAQEVVQLQEKCDEKDEEIKSLGLNYDEDELQQYIDKLHEYNEIKDVAQMLIGKIAEKEGRTTKSLYSNFNLDLQD